MLETGESLLFCFGENKPSDSSTYVVLVICMYFHNISLCVANCCFLGLLMVFCKYFKVFSLEIVSDKALLLHLMCMDVTM